MAWEWSTKTFVKCSYSKRIKNIFHMISLAILYKNYIKIFVVGLDLYINIKTNLKKSFSIV